MSATHDPDPSPLRAAADSFVRAYHAQGALVRDQRTWSPTITLCAADTGAALTIHVREGAVAAIAPGAAQQPDLLITAPEATLCDILLLRRGPNEPYLFGELTVRGAEADYLRLDYITAMLCPQA